ncbi:MAG: hypothetical protein ABEJ72_09610 [Candidatus Aenigmatarchaeota archaeon]
MEIPFTGIELTLDSIVNNPIFTGAGGFLGGLIVGLVIGFLIAWYKYYWRHRHELQTFGRGVRR